ncbi:hypothetical protein GOBAR_DD36922 [Gossypium barbadense]|nr:hypothetical protein GOBAR_DD36922 [Gossypium barbadense]
MVLTGFRFSPTDEEVIEILSQKVSGNTSMAAFDFIIQKDIYDFEPQELHGPTSFPPFSGSESTIGLNKNERYYYCRRETDSREVMGRGWWKATSHLKAVSSPNGEVMAEGQNSIITPQNSKYIIIRAKHNRKTLVTNQKLFHRQALSNASLTHLCFGKSINHFITLPENKCKVNSYQLINTTTETNEEIPQRPRPRIPFQHPLQSNP